jgi:phosphate transport system protein
MGIHLLREVDVIKKDITRLGTMVEENLHRAIKSIHEGNRDLAKTAIGFDREIDDMEMELEENILKVMALHQPVAADLRFLVTVLKVNGELEAIGGQVVNIAKRSLDLIEANRLDIPYDFAAMANKVSVLLRRSLDALILVDLEEAKGLLDADNEVDEFHSKVMGIIKEELKEHPDRVQILICDMTISKCLERIADHIEAIAEDTIYLIDGQIVRHRSKS